MTVSQERNLRKRLNRKTAIFLEIAGILFLLAAVSAVVYCLGGFSPKELYSDPAAPRPYDKTEWNLLVNPPPSVSSLAFIPTPTFRVTSDTQKITLETPALPNFSSANDLPFTVHEMRPGETLDFGGTKFALHAIGTAWVDKPFSEQVEMDYRFFGPDLKPFSPAEMKEMKKRRLDTARFYEGNHPGRSFAPFSLAVVLEGMQEIRLLRIQAFDARTFHPLRLIGGWGTSPLWGKMRHHSVQVTRFHNAPINVVLDIAPPPVKTFEFEPRVGEGFREGDFSCTLVAVVENAGPGHCDHRRDRSGLEKIEFQRAGEEDGRTGLLFFVQPSGYSSALSFAFFDKGKKRWSRASGGGGFKHFEVRYFEGPAQDLERIRISYRPDRRRVILRLPGLPGMPEENQNIQNLFDIRVPFVKFWNEKEWREFLGEVLQLTPVGSPATKSSSTTPPFSFPVEFRDVTVREIAEAYAKAVGCRLRVNETNEYLVLERPKSLREIFRGFLRKIKKIF